MSTFIIFREHMEGLFIEFAMKMNKDNFILHKSTRLMSVAHCDLSFIDLSKDYVHEDPVIIERGADDWVIVDPQSGHKPLDISEYLFAWLRVVSRGMFPRNRVAHIVASALRNTPDISVGERKCIIDKLWMGRWIVGDISYTKSQLLAREATINDIDRLAEGRELFHDIRRQLRIAREESRTIDEWFDAILMISPKAFYCGALLRDVVNDEAQSICRYVDEVNADIGGVMEAIFIEGVLGQDDMCFVKAMLLEYIDICEDKPALLRQLSYMHKSRVYYPSYWYRAALELVNQSEIVEIPENMRLFNIKHTAASLIMRNPHFINFGNDEFSGDVKERILEVLMVK